MNFSKYSELFMEKYLNIFREVFNLQKTKIPNMKKFMFIVFLFAWGVGLAQWKSLKNFGYNAFLPKNSEKVKGKMHLSDSESVAIARVKIGANGIYLLAFNPGPSDDPSYEIYDLHKKLLARIYADSIFIPGNGFIYTISLTDEFFAIHKKFKFKDDTVVEIKQPFYYVGFRTKTKRPIRLYRDFECTKQLAVLAAGSPVLIIGQREDRLLIKSPFGLVGWWKMRDCDVDCKYLQGIYFHGD